MTRRSAQPVLDLIAKLKEGEIRGKTLSASDRRRCVDYLTGEGLSIPEIAQLLGRTERTIQRDRAFIRTQNALSVTPGFPNELAGEMLREARGCTERMRRAARDREAAPSERIEAERACFGIMARSIELLQSLGFLPRTSGVSEPGSLYLGQEAPAELLAELARMRAVLASSQARRGPLELPAETGQASAADTRPDTS
jgi:hypothetical protein